MLLDAGVDIGAAQIARWLPSCGCVELPVHKRPRVAILTTGDELVAVVDRCAGAGADPQPRMRRCWRRWSPRQRWRRAVWVLPTAADTAEALDAALQQAFEADLLRS